MRFCLALSLALAAWCRAGEPAVLSGRVKGEPRVRVTEEDEEGGGYRVPAPLFNYRRLQNVVVYAEPLLGSATPQASSPLVLSRDEDSGSLLADPGFLVVPSGSELEIKNESGSPVTVAAGGSSAGRFAVTIRSPDSRKLSLKGRGLYRLTCIEDSVPCGRVLSAGPYFALADRDGAYSLSLPPGRYRVTAWQERLPPAASEIDLRDGEKATLDFTLTVKGLPEVP